MASASSRRATSPKALADSRSSQCARNELDPGACNRLAIRNDGQDRQSRPGQRHRPWIAQVALDGRCHLWSSHQRNSSPCRSVRQPELAVAAPPAPHPRPRRRGRASGRRSRTRPAAARQAVARDCHAAANPCRQLGCAGRHASSRLAFAFDAPRMSVIITTPASPANSLPMNRGTRIGFLAPSS